ncbi:MAG: hypothetical protein HOZ81_05770 [Streptomyces sp.]|nr:hypothetical protein [Streptomyces sp.]NUT27238.1 hypothetical protein [Streptomyces sp.]
MWQAVETQAPHFVHFNMSFQVGVPSGCDLETVLTTLGSLIGHHETLRTRYNVDELGVPWQVVVGNGNLQVEIWNVGEDQVEEAAGRLREKLTRHPFTAPEISVRAAVVTAGRAPAVMVLSIFHLAMDVWSQRLIEADLLSALHLSSRGGPPALRSRLSHPLDRLAYEQSPAGIQKSQEASQYWLNTMSNLTEAILPAARGAVEEPRFKRIAMTSRALDMAVSELAARHLVDVGSVILAFVGHLLRHRSHAAECGLLFFSHNRFDREAAKLSGTIVQSVPLRLGSVGSSVRQLVKEAHRASLTASSHGQYDPAEVNAAMRGFPEISCAINLVLQRKARSRRENRAHIDVAARQALSETRIVEKGGEVYDDMRFYLLAEHASNGIRLTLLADTALLPSHQITRFLTDLEQIAVAALSGDRIPHPPYAGPWGDDSDAS